MHSPGTISFWDPPADGAGSPNFRRHVLVLVLAWLAATLLLFLCRPGYTFGPTDSIDGWVYTGYQWNLRGHIKEFGPLYYGSRLSWIIPGAILHSLLPPVAANICFKLSVSALFASACGAITYGTAGIRGALLAVCLSVFCPQFIYALHADYVDSAVIMYGALAMAGITLARDSRYWPAWILLAGVMFAGMVVANLTSLAFPGLGIALYHLLWLRWGFWRQLGCAGLYLAAAVVVVAGLGWVNQSIGGEFLFLRPQFEMLSSLNKASGNPWAAKDWHWVWEATWLVLPVGALSWGLFRSIVARSTHAQTQRLTVALTGALAVSGLVAVILEMRGQPVLYFYYYASFQVGLAVPLLATCCVFSAEDRNKSVAWLFGGIALTAVVVVAVDSCSVSTHLIRYLPFLPSLGAIPVVTALALLPIALLAAFMAAGRRGRLLRPALRPEVLLVGILTCSIPVYFHSPNVSYLLRETYASVNAAFWVIDRDFPHGSYRLWEHPGQWGSRSLASTRLWGYRLFTQKPFPQFDPVSVANLAGRTLIITAPVNRGKRVLLEAKRALARFADITHEQIIQVPGAAETGFDLVTLVLKEKNQIPENWEEKRKTSSALFDFEANSSTPYFAALEKNLYGPADVVRSALTTNGEITRFRRTDPRDHLATPFRKLTAPPGAGRQLVITVTMPCDSQTLMVVQDETFQYLRQISLGKAGQQTYVIDVPASSQSIRVHFSSPTDTATALPENFQIYEARQETQK